MNIKKPRWPARFQNLAMIVVLGMGILSFPATVKADSTPFPACIQGTQQSGAIYQICMPPLGTPWNGDVLIFAHGYVDFDRPLDIQYRQMMLADGADIEQLVTKLGYAFATTSYSKNGLAVVPAVADIVDLAKTFKLQYPQVKNTYLTGVSEGGLITTLAVERYPQYFTAGLAMCGPLGNFSQQINYWGNFRVLFDYFFPGTLPGPAMDIPSEVIDNFYYGYWPEILHAIKTQPEITKEMLRVAHVTFNADDPANIEKVVYDLTWYSVFATNDGQVVLGGNPFSNAGISYFGSSNDQILNLFVARYTPDPSVLQKMNRDYSTTGRLKIPLVTMHNTGDDIVPYWHETQYAQKVQASGSSAFYTNIPVESYGHCDFTSGQALAAFVTMTYKATGQLPAGITEAFNVPEVQQNFLSLLSSWILPTLQINLSNLSLGIP